MPGVKKRVVTMLGKEGIERVRDVVWMLPFRHEDRRRMESLAFQSSETPCCHFVRAAKTHVKFFGRRRGAGVFEAVVEHVNDNGLGQQLTLRWWNMPFMSKSIAEDMELVVYGRIKEFKGKLFMDHPEYEVIRGGEDDEGATIHTGRITPVYRLRGGLSQKAVRSAAWHVMEMLDDRFISELLPLPSDKGEFAGWHRSRALHTVHFPATAEELTQASRYLALEEFYGYQVRVVRRRRSAIEAGGRVHAGDGHLLHGLLRELPFELTAAQKRSLGEIRRDMASHAPMNRLLHGDVGSGKTVVALAAMLTAVESGSQAALMAPTQILAEQHYLTAKKWLAPLGVRVELRIGGELGARHASGSARFQRVASGILPDARRKALSGQARYSRRRLPHFERPWAKYMITFSTAERRVLAPASRQITLDAIRFLHDAKCTLYAACVMPDHVHLLMEPRVKEHDVEGEPVFYSLTEILHSLKSFTANAINKVEGSAGNAVWEKESFDRMIRSEADLQEKFGYVLRNPWDAGVVKADEDYAWVWTPQECDRQDAARDTLEACSPQNAAEDAPQILIGTHALLYDRAAMKNLGLVVIDEQHKFGVAQRARLIEKGNTPDVLVMTATPIPRTLTLTIYGDLDVSTLDERPKERGKIVTKVRPQKKVAEAAAFLREQIDQGRQGYLVFPLIEESEKLDAAAALKGHEQWTKLLSPHRVGLLHGKMSGEEKEEVMREFRRGDIAALVSTTVIEVGVDVPNATVMYVHNAERFGLAQLHQLRGRIGRGSHTSYCVLFIKEDDSETKQRLAIMEETDDGFRIAEEDLKRRGPGDVLGRAQSGQAPLRFAELLADTRLVRIARQLAERTLDRDPLLQAPEHAELRQIAMDADSPHAMRQ